MSIQARSSATANPAMTTTSATAVSGTIDPRRADDAERPVAKRRLLDTTGVIGRFCIALGFDSRLNGSVTIETHSVCQSTRPIAALQRPPDQNSFSVKAAGCGGNGGLAWLCRPAGPAGAGLPG